MCYRDPRLPVLIPLLLILLLLFFAVTADAAYEPLTRQSGASQIATKARELGLPESDPIIKRAQEIWWQAEYQFRHDRDMVAVAIYGEAGSNDCTDRHQEMVGAVIVNRSNDPRFQAPTIHAVLSAPGAYAINFTDPNSKIWKRATADPERWRHFQALATKVLKGQVECPPNVVFQANFKQGRVYEKHFTTYSTTYFCFKD